MPDAGQLGPGRAFGGGSSPATVYRSETFGPPRFLANPLVPLPRPWTPAGPLHLAVAVQRRGPRTVARRGLLARIINFEARSRGLGTRYLRFAPPVARTGRKTRFRLPARLYRVGLVTHRTRVKGFGGASYITSSFPRLRLAQATFSLSRRGLKAVRPAVSCRIPSTCEFPLPNFLDVSLAIAPVIRIHLIDHSDPAICGELSLFQSAVERHPDGALGSVKNRRRQERHGRPRSTNMRIADSE